MQIELSIKERIVLFGVLPTELNFDTFQRVKALREILTITDEEKASVDWKPVADADGNQVSVMWDEAKAVLKTVVLSPDTLVFLKGLFNKLNGSEKMSYDVAEVGSRIVALAEGEGTSEPSKVLQMPDA